MTARARYLAALEAEHYAAMYAAPLPETDALAALAEHKQRVAALYIDELGPYPSLPGVDAWGESRDARRYPGPHPVVAHPPCGPWGGLRHQCRGAGRGLGPIAVAQVQAWGGVLEHPCGSTLWAHCALPRPGEGPDKDGGYALEIEQVGWGHVARKKTWLYIVGVEREVAERILRPPFPHAVPTHWVSGGRKKRSGGGAVPPGIKVCSAQQRRRTPPALAEALVQLARAALNEATGRE